MDKIIPDPPDSDAPSPNKNPDSNNNHDTTERIPSVADIRATPRASCTMLTVNPELDVETLLGHACESLASVNVMTMDLADHASGPSRNTLLGIAQVISMSELAVNRALDQLDPIE